MCPLYLISSHHFLSLFVCLCPQLVFFCVRLSGIYVSDLLFWLSCKTHTTTNSGCYVRVFSLSLLFLMFWWSLGLNYCWPVCCISIYSTLYFDLRERKKSMVSMCMLAVGSKIHSDYCYVCHCYQFDYLITLCRLNERKRKRRKNSPGWICFCVYPFAEVHHRLFSRFANIIKFYIRIGAGFFPSPPPFAFSLVF